MALYFCKSWETAMIEYSAVVEKWQENDYNWDVFEFSSLLSICTLTRLVSKVQNTYNRK